MIQREGSFIVEDQLTTQLGGGSEPFDQWGQTAGYKGEPLGFK
jgi:hypothetical protein